MTREHPLWEYHLIGGLKKRRFAAYIKVHHAYADGVTLTTWITRSLDKTRSKKQARPLWTLAHSERKSQSSGEFHLIDAGKKMQLTHNTISLPFSAPDTILNNPLTPDRQLTTASVPMERVHRIRRRPGCR
jgi:hypothetical protein